MMQTRYLIVGASHAGLSAADEIRAVDPTGPITMLSMEREAPYSPTILPYVVAGRLAPGAAVLRDPVALESRGVTLFNGEKAACVDTAASSLTLANGSTIAYDALLIATGAAPTVPRVTGLADVPFLMLRTMADARAHLAALHTASSAIVMGTGLVGMHAAETFALRGMSVEVVRSRAGRNPRILPSYFDETCAGMIQRVFETHDVRFHLDEYAVRVSHDARGFHVELSDGGTLHADLLLVCTGVRPRTEWLDGSPIALDEGVLVDDEMRTSVENVWAAGDVAQGTDFFSDGKTIAAILPEAVAQGRKAGATMARTPGQRYEGAVSMNAFSFFGHRAFSVGLSRVDDGGYDTDLMVDRERGLYRKVAFHGDVLVGMSAIDVPLDPGVVAQLIRRRLPLGADRIAFVRDPVDTGRRLMWRHWR